MSRIARALVTVATAFALGACATETARPHAHVAALRTVKTAPSTSTEVPTTRPATTTTTTTTTPASTTTTNPAGALPQTYTLPPADSPQFNQEMLALWAAIRSGNPSLASSAFFPEAAYEQLKALADPAYDWSARLMTDFDLDIEAARSYLGGAAGSASFDEVVVDESEATWIPPGYCYNTIGYWHTPEARLVYTVEGTQYSIGIASLISWRGEWYVVHLGAVLRSSTVGIVDDPAVGLGNLGGSGGC